MTDLEISRALAVIGALLREALEAHDEALYSMTTKAYNMVKASRANIKTELGEV